MTAGKTGRLRAEGPMRANRNSESSPGAPSALPSWLLIHMALGLLACSSGDGAGPGGAGGTGGTGGSSSGMSWLEDGTRHTAAFTAGSRTLSSVGDMLQITGSDAKGGMAV